jgi:hypothetical protein
MKIEIYERDDTWNGRSHFWLKVAYTDKDGSESILLPCGASRSTAKSKAIRTLQKMIKQIGDMSD